MSSGVEQAEHPHSRARARSVPRQSNAGQHLPRAEIVFVPGVADLYADLPRSDGTVERICLDTPNYERARERLAEYTRAAASRVEPSQGWGPRGEGRPLVVGTIDWALAERLHRCRTESASETLRCYTVQAGHLARLLGGVYIRAMRRADVDQYIAQRIAEGVSAETRRKELVFLRSALRLARLLGAETPEPEATLLPKLRTAYVPRDRWLEEEQFERVLRAMPPLPRRQILVACYTGARRAELQRMQKEHIDWKHGTLRVLQTKPKGSVRYVPLSPRLRAELEPLRGGRGSLLGSLGNLYKEIRRACKKAQVPHFTLNDCRRTFGSWMVQEGAQPYTVGKLMGHANPNMVSKVYGRLSDDSLRDAVKRLPSGKTRKRTKSTRSSAPRTTSTRRGKPGGA